MHCSTSTTLHCPELLPILPVFHGMESENLYHHINDFKDVCLTFHEGGESIDMMGLKLFSFTIKNKAKVWFNSLRPASINTYRLNYKLRF